MSGNLIRLVPSEKSQPSRAHIPTKRARRWWVPGEEYGRQAGVSVFVTQQAFVRFCAHAGSDLYNEVGGWLVGKWRADRKSGEQYIVVEKVLPAPFTRHGGAYLTFTQDTQVALHDELEAQYPDKELVGWYHTHPRMGVFLSEYDIWLHRHFFPKPWQVALVIEPHSITGGFFIQESDGWLDPRRYFGFYELTNGKPRTVVHWRNLMSKNHRQPVEGG